MMAALPLLSLLLLAPVAGALLCWLAPRERDARAVAAAACAIELLIASTVVATLDQANPNFQHVERAVWIDALNIQFLVGVDGLSALFLPLTTLLFLAVVVVSWNGARVLPRLYFSLLQLQLAATIGVFCALDTILFFLFWELSLIPTFFLVGLWGVGAQRRFAAAKYTLMMLASGVPLLFAFVLLAFGHAAATGLPVPGGLSFDLPRLLANPVGGEMQALIFALLLLGFAAKTPLFPLHTWLPLTAMEGPVAVGALLVGLKLGVYGLIRFAIPLAPVVARELHWLLAALGTIGMLYGALAALAQTNLRRMLAYAGISHVGLVMLGVAAFNEQGLAGALLQTLNFTLIAGGLFLLTACLHRRIGSTDTLSLGGAAQTMPRLAALYVLFALAAIGVPGTSGFPAELMLLTTALTTHTGAGLAASFGTVIGAAAMLGMVRRSFFGPVTNATVAQASDLHRRELAVAIALAAPVLCVGLAPDLALDVIRSAAGAWTGQGR
jgi:NADH-quinone oxidoreductase subunit M